MVCQVMSIPRVRELPLTGEIAVVQADGLNMHSDPANNAR